MGGDGKGMRDEVYVQREREGGRVRERESERGSLVMVFPNLNPLPSKFSVYVFHRGGLCSCLFVVSCLCVHKQLFINTKATLSMARKSVISQLVTCHLFANLGY